MPSTDTAARGATKLLPEEVAAIQDASKQNQALMDRVGQGGIVHATLESMAARARQAGEPVVMAMIPKSFVLTLDGVERPTVQFIKGVHPVPQAWMSHWYVINHGVKEYAGTAVQARAQPILSSNVFAGDAGIDAAAVDDITVAAYTLSGLTTDAWNALSMEERGERMRAVFNYRKEEGERAKAKQAKSAE